MVDLQDYKSAYKSLAEANAELQEELLHALHVAVGYRYWTGPLKDATWEDCWQEVRKLLEKHDYELFAEIYEAEDDEDGIDLGLLG